MTMDGPDRLKLTLAMGALEREIERAMSLHAPFNSDHEAFAVLLEEVEEYKTEVFKKREDRSQLAMNEELLQIAAVAIRAHLGL